ncbi:hypothetical protein ACEW7V_00490 [Areca yellow leaf disease phytoplasma]|uniref:hypothetical protein n=1 Tax=Areca yellow leaf disease phytoplasma TaxID=927614 RepID=UPI0035B52EB9
MKLVKLILSKKKMILFYSEPIYKIEIIKQNDTYYLITDDRFLTKRKIFRRKQKLNPF